jgi:hypothetical protein
MRWTPTLRRFSWLMFGLAWIPFTLIFVGMIGLPDGSYAWTELPLVTRIGLIGSGVMFALSMVGLIGAPIMGLISSQSVIRSGRKGQATIIDMQDTGTTINQNPLVHFTLQVDPIDGPSFEAETEKIVPRLLVPHFQPGLRVPVRYDSKAKRAVITDLDDIE